MNTRASNSVKSVVADGNNNNNNNQASTSKNSTPDHEHFFTLLEIFPDICPTYLRHFLMLRNVPLEVYITSLLVGVYKKREVLPQPIEEEPLNFETQLATLVELFPDADPTFLQHHCEHFTNEPDAFNTFVADLFEKKNYPTKEQYLKVISLSAQEKQYTTEFDIKKFLELFPEPGTYFSNTNRTATAKGNYSNYQYAIKFLKNHFDILTHREIVRAFSKCNCDIVQTAKELTLLPKSLKNKRKQITLPSINNIPLLQEIAYIKHKKEIGDYIKQKKRHDKEAKQTAKEGGLLNTCECCFDDEVMPHDTIMCEKAHLFCTSCVRIGCEVKVGEGQLNFPCLADCDQEFSLRILQSVLTPKVFSKLAQRKQMEEVKAAGIEDLEFCPFCDFATIPVPGDKLFRCLNYDCMQESCRECKKPSHIPLRCDEVETDEEVQQRTYVENKMTEALLRKCHKCGRKFIKEDGCNKMTCSCGAMMCYVCQQPVENYKHFNGQGGDKYHLCPLFSNTNELHLNAIKRSAEDAKRELGLNKALKHDPAEDIDQHYKAGPSNK